jgi:serine/threonine protein kinase
MRVLSTYVNRGFAMTEESIFLGALEKKDPAERAVYLDTVCGKDKALRHAVEQLLIAHEKLSPLDRPAFPAISAPTAEFEPFTVGVRIGPYTLVQRLGEGAMGSVWVTQQSEPVKRKVALKVIKAGMDSKSIVNRFEHERQTLALMDHPNIARVFDGGMTADGRLFFVMELVNGLPLNKFCDEARLTPRQRLDLFVPICQAVQHAHQKGIVHRDLKPSNILVTLYDGRPVPKVIDFGVAKALAGKLIDESLTTQFGTAVGTLEYMAPEQAGFSALDIDTRADIYSLGVILYELLTGLIPIDSKRLRQAGLHEMNRILKEVEPPRPSTRLSSDSSSPSLAAVRQMEPKHLTALLRGELDWIIMKCLEKSRDRRYQSANALARDVQRYLADEPVEARPPSFRYRAGKFFRRNKGTVLMAAVVTLLLVGGIIGTTLGMLDAIHHEEIAVKVADDSKKAQLAEAAAKVNEEKAKLDAQSKLWGFYLSESIVLSYSGKRPEALRAIQAALELPVPKGRTLDELRNAAITALWQPDFGLMSAEVKKYRDYFQQGGQNGTQNPAQNNPPNFHIELRREPNATARRYQFSKHDVILEGRQDGTTVIMQMNTSKELAQFRSPETGNAELQNTLAEGFLLTHNYHRGRTYVWDLPLIRRQLAEIGLDWDGPPYFPEK